MLLHYRVHNSVLIVLSQINPLHALPPYLFKIHLNPLAPEFPFKF